MDRVHTTENASAIPENRKPQILLIGTSNVGGIDADRLTSEADVHKVIQYTLDDTAKYLNSAPGFPNIVILHSLTNDIKVIKPQSCVDKLYEIVTTDVEAKWPGISVIISLATPRYDDIKHFNSAQLTNALIRQKFNDTSNVSLVDVNVFKLNSII
ncbi:hypothetical protein FSP39_021744 [Pinctada imbricata]|uniref:Uncharacterized protein n=1 Tax=Pinctada imbricata TaxID=66713 RepID=A0AA89C1T0_PINIB|nr:hypothetical protein FSP39_021744 [Pinctada imbricata]